MTRTAQRSGGPSIRRAPVRRGAILPAAAVVLLALLVVAVPAFGADAPAHRITMTVTPLLGGRVVQGEWAAVRVRLENDGPAVDGEIRVSSAESGATRYGLAVQLPTGARQEHIAYGQAGFYRERLSVELVAGGEVLLHQDATVRSDEPGTRGVAIVAERPERLMADVRNAAAGRGGRQTSVDAMAPGELPGRVLAWAAVDELVWQDIPLSTLSMEQLDAIRTWIALGGHLVIVAGSSGDTVLGGFPADLLPYQPDGLVDVPAADLAPLVGVLPADATPLPALAGDLLGGRSLADSGDRTIAATMRVGEGSVTLLGIDPATAWLTGTAAARALWGRVLPVAQGAIGGGGWPDDSALVAAVGYLPALSMPRMDHLFLLFLAYVILLGPINYLVLRRLDRREWAWITMPVLVIGFTAGTFLLGVVLKGTDVVVNEVGIVRGSADADRGMADVYAGVFSPVRSTYDVRVNGGAFLSESIQSQQDRSGPGLDILLGEPARLRAFEVGFGAVRPFRAQAAVDTPRIETDLRLEGGRITGTIRNASELPLDEVRLAYSGRAARVGSLDPGESRAVDLETGSGVGGSLLRRVLDVPGPGGPPLPAGRVAVVRALAGDEWWEPGWGADPLAAYGPVLLAWRSGGVLDIDLGTGARRVGETLYLLPVQVSASGAASFTGGAIERTIVDIDAVEGFADPSGLYLSRGTMTVAYRPAGLEGTFEASGLLLRLAGGPAAVESDGAVLAPRPADEQPDQEDPVTGVAVGAEDERQLPALQLFDHVADRWVEFEAPKVGLTHRIADPGRFLADGGVLVRFVQRASDQYQSFFLGVRLEGTVR
jgi:hypothetical protein